MAAVKFLERDYAGALDLYGRAMRRYPRESGSATRVGFGMACYRLGQIDRAKASFRRAHELDPENVEAMMGMAVLELGSLDPDVLSPREYRSRAEGVIKMISMANLADHTNAMVQNQLSSCTYYYFGFRSQEGVTTQIVKCVVREERNCYPCHIRRDDNRMPSNFFNRRS